MSTGPQAGGFLPPTRAYRETNGLAIAALILGIIAIVPVAIVLGIIALVQISRRGDDGKGLAIAGIVISCAWVVIGGLAVVLLVDNLADFDEFGNVTKAGLISEYDLEPGYCVNDPDESDLLLSAVPCDEPHDAEVFATFTLKGDDYPGAGNIRRRSSAGCRNRFAGSFDDSVRLGADTSVFTPDRLDWTTGERVVFCFGHFGERRSGLQQRQFDPVSGPRRAS